MRDTIEMARRAGAVFPLDGSYYTFERHEDLKAFEALVRADEREVCAKRRSVLAFCPYTGRPRHPSDIASDPHGILILVPDQPLRGMTP